MGSSSTYLKDTSSFKNWKGEAIIYSKFIATYLSYKVLGNIRFQMVVPHLYCILESGTLYWMICNLNSLSVTEN